MNRALRYIGVSLLVLLGLFGTALFWLPYFLSSDYAREKLTGLVERRTGKVLKIAGDTSFRLLPNIAIVANDITLANPPVDRPQPLMKMKSLKADLSLAALLRGEVEVTDITFDRPQLLYHVVAAGKTNWTTGSPLTRTLRAPKRALDLGQVSFGRVEMNGAEFRYKPSPDAAEEVFAFDTLSLEQIPSLTGNEADQSVQVLADIGWRKETFRVTARVHRLLDLFTQAPATVDLDVTSRLANGNFSGQIEPQAGPRFDGRLASSAPSLRGLMAFFDRPLPAGTGFGAFSVEGAVKGNLETVDFKADKVQIDATSMKAAGALALKETPLRLTADIDAERIDVNPYLAGTTPGGTAVAASAGKPAPSAFDLDLAGLKALNGRLTLKFKELVYQKATLQNGVVAASLDNGLLDADVSKLDVYRGTAQGKLQLDARTAQPGLAGKLQLRQVLAGAALRDFVDFDKVSGNGDIDVDLRAKGRTINDLTGTLAGTTKFQLKDGRIDGVDIDRFSGVKPEELPDDFYPSFTRTAKTSGKPQTAYKVMSGQFKVDKGVADNNDFFVDGNNYRVKAAGRINLVERTLTYKVAPSLFTNSWNFTLPFKISGPWNKLKKEFDVFAFLGGKKQTVTRSTVTPTLLKVAPKPENEALESRGLKSAAEIDAYLAGQKIDPSKNGIAPRQ